jgi:DNA-binding MarR family transcriptional regulator
MRPRMKGDASNGATPRALMDAVGGFMRAYKSRLKTILTEVSSGESTPSRVMVVVVLRKSGPLSMSTIAAHVGLPKSNITALVDDLEAEGVVRRKPDAEDRRITQVELTAKGRALCAREYDAYEKSVSAVFEALPPVERAALLSALERVTTRLVEDEKDAATSTKARESAASNGARRRSLSK